MTINRSTKEGYAPSWPEGHLKDLAKKETGKMPCIHLKSGTRLNLKKDALKSKSFRKLLKKMDLTEQTRSVYFPASLKKERPKK